MKYFSITVDTEADNAWTSPNKIEMDNFKEIPRFQELCEKYDIIPIYLLTYEYATNEPAINFFKKKLIENKCEIGHHLHAWTTPPFSNEKNGVDMDWLHAYQFELPNEIFERKMDTLHSALIKAFGIQPIIHRAGRWGIDDRTIDWLSRNNYLIDTSVIPYYDLSNNRGKRLMGNNYSTFTKKPFYWKTEKTSSIIEVPVSVMIDYNSILRFSKRFKSLIPGSTIFNKLFNKIHRPRMLRPNPSYSINYYKEIIIDDSKNKDFLNMMLHSSELALGCSPFTMESDDYDKIWKILDYSFKSLKKKQYSSLTTKELYRLFTDPKSLCYITSEVDNL